MTWSIKLIQSDVYLCLMKRLWEFVSFLVNECNGVVEQGPYPSDLDSLICRNIGNTQHFISARQLLKLSRLMVPLGVMGSNNCVIGITVKLYACKWRTKLGRKINPAGPPPK